MANNVSEEKKEKRRGGRKPMTPEEKAAAAEARAAEKAKADGLRPELIIQYQGDEIDLNALVEAAKTDFHASKKRTLVTGLKLYVKPEERTAYYVINEKMRVRFRSKDKQIDEDTMSSRVFMKGRSIVKTKHKIQAKTIVIVLTIILFLLCAVLTFVGNFLFNFALNPNASYTMNDLLQGGDVEGIGNGPVIELSPARESWREYSAKAYDWFASEGQSVTYQRPDGSLLRASYFPQEGHKYAILFHGYTGASWQMAPYGKVYYDMGWSILTPDALAHGNSDGDYIGMGWLERPDVIGWINTTVSEDAEAEIVLHGVSMGGATVMMAAGEDLPDNVKCIVEDCGYSSVWDEFRLQLKNVFSLPAFPLLDAASLMSKIRAGYSFKEASSVKQLEKATVPMLFIHGDADTFVPFSMLDVVYEACASAEKEKLVVHDAAHGAAADTDPELYWNTVTSFVGKYVS